MEAFVTFCARALVAGGDRSEKNWPSSKCPSCLHRPLPSIILQVFIFLAPSSNNSGLVFKVSDWNFDYIFNLTIFTQTSDTYVYEHICSMSFDATCTFLYADIIYVVCLSWSNLFLLFYAKSSLLLLSVPMHIVYFVKYIFPRNKLRPILKFQEYYPIEQIFVPACSSARKIHFLKF